MADTEHTEAKPPQVDPAVEREARGMGWRPKEEFRGDPANWTDAETYVKRGRDFIPILRAENTKLKGQVDATAGELRQVKEALAAATEAIEGLKEFQSVETQRAVKQARANLVKQLKDARDEGDVDREAEILSGIGDLDAAAREAKKNPPKKEEKPSAPEPKIDPAYAEWERDNQWIVTDGRRRALALQIASEMRQDTSQDHLKGKAFFDAVAEEVDKVFGVRRSSKVDGGRPNGGSPPGRSSSSSEARTFDDLPADAKAACREQAKKLVGPNRGFADEKSWQAYYAKVYFEGESQ